jgi:hypothetical protein
MPIGSPNASRRAHQNGVIAAGRGHYVWTRASWRAFLLVVAKLSCNRRRYFIESWNAAISFISTEEQWPILL